MRVRDLLTMSTGHHDEDVRDFPLSGGRERGEERSSRGRCRTSRARSSSTTRRRATCCRRSSRRSPGRPVVDYLQAAALRAARHREPDLGGEQAGRLARRLRAERAHRGHRALRPALSAEGAVAGQAARARRLGRDGDVAQMSNGSSPTSDWEQGYGYQFWRSRHGFYRGDGAHGQFCLVLPQHDTVIAITSGTRDMASVMNLVWDRLRAGVEAGAADRRCGGAPEADRQAREPETARRRPGPPRRRRLQPRSASATRSTRTRCRSNRSRSSRRRRSGDVVVRDANRRRRSARRGRLQRVAERHAEAERDGPADPIAASGAWTADDTYTLDVVRYRTPFATTYKLRFAGDQLFVSAEQNVPANAKVVEIVGRLATSSQRSDARATNRRAAGAVAPACCPEPRRRPLSPAASSKIRTATAGAMQANAELPALRFPISARSSRRAPTDAYRLAKCRIRHRVRQHSGWLPFGRAILVAGLRIAEQRARGFRTHRKQSTDGIHVHPRLGHARQQAKPPAPAAIPADRRNAPAGFRPRLGRPRARRPPRSRGRSARLLRSLPRRDSTLPDAGVERARESRELRHRASPVAGESRRTRSTARACTGSASVPTTTPSPTAACISLGSTRWISPTSGITGTSTTPNSRGCAPMCESVQAGTPIVTFNHIPFVSALDMIGGYRDADAAPTLIKLGDRTVFRHVVSNFKDVLAVLQQRDWPLALGGHFHTRESIRYESRSPHSFPPGGSGRRADRERGAGDLRRHAVSRQEPRHRRRRVHPVALTGFVAGERFIVQLYICLLPPIFCLPPPSTIYETFRGLKQSHPSCCRICASRSDSSSKNAGSRRPP